MVFTSRKAMMSGVSYPLDGYANTQAVYSVRRLLSSYTGKCLGLRRDSDNAEMDFGFDVDGKLHTAAISSWLDGATGYIHTWYDQSGNGYNMTQTTATRQPTYGATAIGGKPSLYFDGGTFGRWLRNSTVAPFSAAQLLSFLLSTKS